MSEIKHRILAKEFIQSKFNFKQIWREGDLAIYEKWKDGWVKKGYEAIKIRRHNGYTIGGIFCEPAEMYPSDNQWGVLGFTATTYDEALKCIDRLKGVNIPDEPKEIEPKRKRGRPRKGN